MLRLPVNIIHESTTKRVEFDSGEATGLASMTVQRFMVHAFPVAVSPFSAPFLGYVCNHPLPFEVICLRPYSRQIQDLVMKTRYLQLMFVVAVMNNIKTKTNNHMGVL